MKKRIQQHHRGTDWGALATLATWALEAATRLQQIPAPTFAEDERGAYLLAQFRALGLHDLERDGVGNIYGRIPGAQPDGPALMLSAHLDTVFPAETDLSLTRTPDTLYGPGLGDNSMGVAGMLACVKWLQEHQITPACDIWCVGTTGEEGLGDLRGMRAAYEGLRERVAAVINLEGLAFGHIYNGGIAVHRLHITARADGGHSWLHFGRPSAIHGILQLGAKITQLRPSTQPRTTFNVGMIEGGQSINTISATAGLWLDLRSESQKELDRLVQQVRQLIDSVERPGLSFHVEVVGDRPAGHIPNDHPLVKGALAALESVGAQGTLESGSTDGNIPLAAGCPAVTIGITRGGNAHRLDEYIEVAPISGGLQQLILLTLAAAEDITEKR